MDIKCQMLVVFKQGSNYKWGFVTAISSGNEEKTILIQEEDYNSSWHSPDEIICAVDASARRDLRIALSDYSYCHPGVMLQTLAQINQLHMQIQQLQQQLQEHTSSYHAKIFGNKENPAPAPLAGDQE